MAKEFTTKEVKELINYYNKLLDDLLNATKYSIDKLQEIKNKIIALKTSGYFSALASAEIKGFASNKDDKGFKSALTSIYCYVNCLMHIEECRNLYYKNHVELRVKLDAVLPACNSVSWFFLPRKRKEQITDKYKELINFKQSDFVKRSVSEMSTLSGLSSVSIDAIKVEFFNNKEIYLNAVQTSDSKAFKGTKYIAAVQTLIDNYSSIQKNVDYLTSGIDELKEIIKDSIEHLVAQELINTLKTIPIDEVNRDKKGIRTKALKDAGYLNMADVYVANTYNISSVHGVSMDVAYTIKKMANEFAKKAQAGIKIKLSVDDKNKYSTAVVEAIHRYRTVLKSIESFEEINKTHLPQIERAFIQVKTVGDGAIWPFLSDVKIKECQEAYSYLNDIVNGDLSKTINNAVQSFKTSKKSVSSDPWQDFAENSIQFYNIIEQICPGVLGTDDSVYGLPEDLAKEIQDECIFPDGLLCTLRRYQEWGVKYILHQERVLLGDEMGLGKTIQAIATMVSLKNTGATHFVVVCPASVLTNWCREIVKHSKLKVIKVHGYEKMYAFRAWLKVGGVAVTTYESTGVFKFEDPNFKISQLVVDEAHYIKNPDASRSKRVRELCKHSERLLFMTGTALENRVDEMIELISVLRLDIANKVNRIAFMSTAPQFRQEIAPVYYRRKREDVLTELPDLIESEEWCSLTPEEEYFYETSVLNRNYMDARRVSWNIDDIHNSSKAKRLLEIIEDAKNDGRKILVFSFFLDTIRKVHDLLGFERCLNPINGAINPARRQEIIDEFDAAPAGTVLCAQIQSGGTGLNIQAASVVVICEPQLKPSIENQAISRAYRMGQSRNVQVFRLLCENTIDERMMNLLEEKQAIFDAFADKSVAAEKSIEIDDKSFGDLINEEIERIKKKNGGETPRPYEPEDVVEEDRDTVSDNFDSGYTQKTSKKAVILDPITASKYDSSITYRDEMAMSYKELVSHLLSKYGVVKGDYFLTESCRSKNTKISRGNEGLFCHHIDEDKAIMLSNPNFAVKNPFEYQKADRLVYCDILEHLLLHIKIAEEPRNEDANENELVGIGGAATFICRQINDCYSNKELVQPFMIRIREQIKDKFGEYIAILKKLNSLISKNKNYSMMFSKEDICSDYDGEVVKKVFEAIV